MRCRLAIPILLAAATSSHKVRAQTAPSFRSDYTVEVKDTIAHLFHVTATFRNIHQPSLQLSLPIWTPGWYTLEYYAKNIRHFTVTDGSGRHLSAPLRRAQTWSVDTRGTSTVVAAFDYYANVLSLNQAKITSTFAFFTGTQLFLEPIGHRNARATVRFVVPSGWRIATALAETPDSAVYAAADYDALVDAPTWLGAFALYQFDVDGKRHSLVFSSAVHSPPDTMGHYIDQLATMVRTAGSIFGGLPYDKYLFFWLPDSAESGAAGGLEHANSQVHCCDSTTQLNALSANRFIAHEFFHLWNVKRIRPAELWPYDYSRPIDTPSLWVSEGITDYYGAKVAYRAGFDTENQFLESLARAIGSYELQQERAFVSLTDASRSTWRAYLHEPVNYYAGGYIAGALLDLSILHDTRGRAGLDDVMRALYTRFYQSNKGFTPEQLIRTIGTVAGRDYHDFFRRYIAGVEVPPYDSIFGYAGLHNADHGRVRATIGMLSTATAQGRRVDAVGPARFGSLAGMAGFRVGDVLLAMDGVPIDRVRFDSQGNALIIRPDDNRRVVFTILRDSTRFETPVALRPGGPPSIRLEHDSTATADRIAVRRAWLAMP